MRPQWIATFALLLSFGIGLVAGVFLERGLLHGRWSGEPAFFRPMPPELALRRFAERLNLTPAQREKLEKILEEHRQKFLELRRTTRPQVEAIEQSLRSNLRAMLTPEQQARFDHMVKRFDEMHGRRRPAPHREQPDP